MVGAGHPLKVFVHKVHHPLAAQPCDVHSISIATIAMQYKIYNNAHKLT